MKHPCVMTELLCHDLINIPVLQLTDNYQIRRARCGCSCRGLQSDGPTRVFSLPRSRGTVKSRPPPPPPAGARRGAAARCVVSIT